MRRSQADEEVCDAVGPSIHLYESIWDGSFHIEGLDQVLSTSQQRPILQTIEETLVLAAILFVQASVTSEHYQEKFAIE